jgi:hypothetical protein
VHAYRGVAEWMVGPMNQDPPPKLDPAGEGPTEKIDPIGSTIGEEPPPPPPPTGPGTHLQRDFDTNAAMVKDILAVSATDLPEEEQTASTVDAGGDDKREVDQPVSAMSGVETPISPDFFPSTRPKKRMRRSK